MKIVFFNRFFFPDTSATSQILSDLAFHLAGAGREIHVVTSRVPGGEEAVQKVRGVTIHRVAAAPAGVRCLAHRALAYFRYYRGARSAARRLLESGDVAVLKTDPPLLSAAVGPLAKARGAKVVVWMQDVFPEVAHVYGIPGMGGALGSVLRRSRDRSLAIADRVVAIGERIGRTIAQTGVVPPDRLHVIHNWADGSAIVPIERADCALRRTWGLVDHFVVGYSGNLGRVHEFDTLLGAAEKLASEPDIRFLIVGRGPRLAETQAQVQRRALRNVIFEPHQERSSLAASLCVPDVHISILRREFEGLVHPSKLYGIMAAGRPTLFIGDPDGETASILAEAHGGASTATGDIDGLAAAIISLRDDPGERTRMGVHARRAFEERFALPVAIGKWEDLLVSLK